MDLKTINPAKTLATQVEAQQEFGPDQIAESIAPAKATDSRAVGQSFAKEVMSSPKVQELKSIPIVTKGANLALKTGSRVFKLLGFASASGSLALYFLFNLKTLAMITGVFPLMCFVVAHFLSKSLSQNAETFSLDPNKILKKAIEKPEIIETNLSSVIAAADQIKDMKNSDPKKQEGLELIETIKEMIDTVLKANESFDDVRTLNLKHELERFQPIYDEIKAQQANAPLEDEAKTT